MQIEERRTVDVAGAYDVIVAGGGPAGVGAALAAARQGARTLLVERYGFLGGMWTAGLVNPFFDAANKGGIVGELVTASGVDVLFHSWIAAPITEGPQVKGIIMENKSGRRAYQAQVVIDCTGDADVAARAGAEFAMGRADDGKMQPMTLMFVLGNVDYDQEDGKALHKLMTEAVNSHDTGYTIHFEHPWIIPLPNQNNAVVQLTHIRNRSAIDAEALTQAEFEGRKQVHETVELFQKYVPRLKGVELLYTAPQIGIRESRRVVGEYSLCQEELLSGAQFDDGITTVTFGIDIHEPDSIRQTSLRVKPYQLPFRSLIPKGMEGLLVAGRCISGSYEAHASYRVTGDCTAMAQAAGTAASMAVKSKCAVRDVPVNDLIASLRAQGCKGVGRDSA